MACNRVSQAKSNCFSFSKKADKRVAIYSSTDTVNTIGGVVTAWGAPDTVWAYIRPMSINEQVQSEQVQSRVSHEFIIRYQSQYKDTKTTGAKIIKYDGRYFEIKGIKNLGADMKSEGTRYQSIKSMENAAIEGDLP